MISSMTKRFADRWILRSPRARFFPLLSTSSMRQLLPSSFSSWPCLRATLSTAFRERPPVSEISAPRKESNVDVVAVEKERTLDHGNNNVRDYEWLEKQGITSRPVPGGNWNVKDPLGWTKDFGRRSPSTWQRLKHLVKLKPGDEGYFDVKDIQLKGVAIVRTEEQARKVLQKLYAAPPETFHACDTEVMGIDLKSEGPVGNGYVTCLSIFSGHDFDYGLGENPGSALWIDNLDDACGILQIFKDWLEDPRYLKVWHNYGFDRHVLWNEGILVQGFGGDTMHMARLQDTSRTQGPGKGYSLEVLSEEFTKTPKDPMKKLFGVPRKRKDGTDGSIVDVPPVEELQRNPEFRKKFISYSVMDAIDTWLLREVLQMKLSDMNKNNGHPAEWIRCVDAETGEWRVYTLYDYYIMHMRPFGEVLTDLERRGIRVDAKNYLASVEKQARQERLEHETIFRNWAAAQYPPELRWHGLALNPASSAQLQTFLFGGAKNVKTSEPTETVREFKVPRAEVHESALQALREHENVKQKNIRSRLNDPNVAREQLNRMLEGMNIGTLKEICDQYNLLKTGTKPELKSRIEQHLVFNAACPTVLAKEETEANDKEKPQKRTTTPTTNIPVDEIMMMTVAQLKAECRKYGIKGFSKLHKKDLQEVLIKNQEEESLELQQNQHSDEELRQQVEGRGLPSEGTRQELQQRLLADDQLMSELSDGEQQSTAISGTLATSATGLANDSLLMRFLENHLAAAVQESDEPKYIDVKVMSLAELLGKKLKPFKYTEGGAPSVTADVLRKLAGDPDADPPTWGLAYEVIGEEGCRALASLCSIGSIDTMIANFLTSLQELVDEDSRVHCSLNMNTETGRLSARRPNLQNQPALEKDRYKIRKAFQSAPGNNLIVADYGQLELRILASLTNCQSMIDAFKAGGDFHSRTAFDMFDYIREEVEAGKALLEWDYAKGEPTKPLVKDKFGSERRKAKVLNFSIAYGKTAHGLSQDWGVEKEEAEGLLKKWYAARPEVDQWQKKTKLTARKYGYTRTLMGRYRHLPDAMSWNRKLQSHAERASINTPIQGGAADIAMMAMIKINQSQKLKDLGWILLLQIHDEVILEGPEETAEEAFAEVLSCMQEPWRFGLNPTVVPLVVDGSYTHKTWYDAK